MGDFLYYWIKNLRSGKGVEVPTYEFWSCIKSYYAHSLNFGAENKNGKSTVYNILRDLDLGFYKFKHIHVSLMPKLIDNYVLNRKIGAGQYGEVYKGYDRANNNDIAVKAIKRENVKGSSSIYGRKI